MAPFPSKEIAGLMKGIIYHQMIPGIIPLVRDRPAISLGRMAAWVWGRLPLGFRQISGLFILGIGIFDPQNLEGKGVGT